MAVTIRGDGTVSTGLNADSVDGSNGAQVIHVQFASSAPIKVGGHTSLDVVAWPGQGQFRVTHSEGNTNFIAQVTRISSGEPVSSDNTSAVPHVVVTSTHIDVWFVADRGLQTLDIDFFLTLIPY